MAKRKTDTSLESKMRATGPRRAPREDACEQAPQLLQIFDARTFSAAMAARLTGLHPKRVGRWLQGYRYEYEVSTGHV